MTSDAHPSLAAIDFFRAKLDFETDPADLAADRATGHGPVVIDVRSDAAWQQGHIPHAVHIPRADLESRIGIIASDVDTSIVVYCWGPGCTGSTRAPLTLATLGYRRVRELIGGFEYWAREGLAVETAAGRTRPTPDPLTAVSSAASFSALPVPGMG